MHDNNPLTKYYRQPKIYLSLPSKGEFYPPGTIQGDPLKLPVFGMSAMDEILLKTPDALFSGESTVQVIKSCIPGLQQPWLLPSIDLDAILIAIRIATYGQMMPSTFKCKSCKEENKFDLDLTKGMDYLAALEYADSLIVGPLKVNFRPLTYKEITDVNLKTYELRRKLAQSLEGKSETQKAKYVNETMKDIATLQVKSFIKGIASVETEDETVEDTAFIDEWLQNSDKEFYDKIKKHLEEQVNKWKVQDQKVKCADCEAENVVKITLDTSDFFVRG